MVRCTGSPPTPAPALRAASLAVGLVWLPVILFVGPSIHDLTYDDAFYYFQIGRNIADGAGSTFDGMNVTNGYHPLWMLVVSAVYAVGFDGTAAIRAVLVVQPGAVGRGPLRPGRAAGPAPSTGGRRSRAGPTRRAPPAEAPCCWASCGSPSGPTRTC